MFDFLGMNYYIKSSKLVFCDMKAIVSEKGQVTIPKALRTKLGIQHGTVLEFDAVEGKLIAVKSSREQDPVSAVTGVIRKNVDVDAYIRKSRGPEP